MNRKGISAFLGIIISLVILIPVGFIVFLIISSGASKLVSFQQSVNAYVSATLSAMQTGTSVVVPPSAPDFGSTTFLAQFYGGTACMSMIDQLSRSAILAEPTNPSSLTNKYFICVGTMNMQPIISYMRQWNYLPTSSGSASFPYWFSNYGQLNSQSYGLAQGVSGSKDTLSFFTNSANPAQTLAGSCADFFNATTTSYGYGVPSAYITGLSCVPLMYSNSSLFLSVATSGCSSSNACNSNPVAFLYGNPSYVTTQICSSGGGNSLVCQFYLK